MITYTATYSPDDNKLRLYASSRLDRDIYERAKSLGFKWAPKQELFVAPAWSPSREDFLLDLVDEIEDEDTSLVDRAEERSERFEDYSSKRSGEAERSYQAVSEIASGIPLGQPILVGHHSERHARKHAEKIDRGMRKAVKLWETSKYWQDRAKGAIRHAKYKELPPVRHRRIKSLESDLRGFERNYIEATTNLAAWEDPDLDRDKALAILNCAGYLSMKFPKEQYPNSTYEGEQSLWGALKDGVCTLEEAKSLATLAYTRSAAWSKRWIDHTENRLGYERAMLGESGGLAAEKFEFEVGGRVLTDYSEWVVILRINKTRGEVSSLTTTARYVSKVSIERVRDYRAPEAGDKEKVIKATKLAPLFNYPGEGFTHMTKAQYDRIGNDYKKGKHIEQTEKAIAHRVRYEYGWKGGKFIFLTDVKETWPSAPVASGAIEEVEEGIPHNEPVARAPRPTSSQEQPNKFEELKETIRGGGVKVFSAPSLFPTPPVLAERMIDELGICPGDRVLEPSAGTGNLLRAIGDRYKRENGLFFDGHLTAIEIDSRLAGNLQSEFPDATVLALDFLEYPSSAFVPFNRIAMNPPFENAIDIKHVLAAYEILAEGGKLVAIVANGPRQTEKLKPLCSSWEVLPEGTFKESGTGVRTVLLTMEKE